MISIKKYLNLSTPSDETLRRVLNLLVHAVESHTVEGDPEDYRRFRTSLQIALKELGPESSADQLLVMVGGVTTAMREYSERTTEFVRSQAAEYHRIVHLLTQTVTSCSEGDDRTLGRLKNLEAQFQRAAQVEDVRALRIELGHCLASLRESVREHKEEAAKAARMRAEVEAACRPVPRGNTRDPAQPAREDADVDGELEVLTPEIVQTAITEQGPGQPRYVLVLAMDRFAALHARFGAELADRILSLLKREVKRRLNEEDKLYNWHGSVFVALLSRGTRLAEVTAELARTVGTKFEQHMEVGNRSILLTPPVHWVVFPMEGPEEKVLRKIDEFAARHNERASAAGAPARAR